MIPVKKYVKVKSGGSNMIIEEEQQQVVREPVITPLNITPSTSSQVFNTMAGIDGYAPVSVSGVNASIDANIQAENIKDGVSILGVEGSYTGSGATIDSLSITPTTSQQTITASGGVDGYSPITVSAVTSSIDANITAGNIKSGVTILGVTGTAEIAPTHYIEKKVGFTGALLNSDKLIDFSGITGFGAGVLAGQYYDVSFPSNTTVDLSSVTEISGFMACGDAFYGSSGIKTVDLSSLIRMTGTNCCSSMFNSCTSLTSVDLGSLTTVSGQGGASSMFSGCTNLTSVDISSLTTISSYSACGYMFRGCSSLTSVDLGSLTTLSWNSACPSMFEGCTSLASVDISSLTTVTGSSACQQMFRNCSSLTSMTFNSLNSIVAANAFQQMFSGCTSLTSMSFPALKSTSFGSFINQFNNMLSGVTGCTVHFPSNLQSVIGSWSDVTNGFGGTNTTVLFDLTATE